jgi:sarcosine oxidase subunit gamma
MPDAPARRSPLFHRPPIQDETGALRIEERPFLGKFILRSDPSESAKRLSDALGIGLPLEPLTSTTSGETSLLWLGPDEWMLVTAPLEAMERSAAARQALASVHHQLVAVGDYYTVIEIAGAKAREALMKLTTLDLHPRAFRAGMVAGSVFGRATATLWQVSDDAAEGGPVFRLFIRWSMADYLWCLIADAGREWGVPEQVPTKGETLTLD